MNEEVALTFRLENVSYLCRDGVIPVTKNGQRIAEVLSCTVSSDMEDSTMTITVRLPRE